MKWVRDLAKWSGPGRPLYLALGNFDGVHRGHQFIINRTVELAREKGGKAAVLVFNPHPQAFLEPASTLPLLTDLAGKAEIISALGVDYFLVEPFDLKLAGTSPDLFVKYYLWEKLRVSGVVIGEDYSFGRGGLGTPPIMGELGKRYGFQVEICPLLEYEGQGVSSSAIRGLIAAGEVSKASRLLNYYFYRSGEVIAGAGRGGQQLYPTANLQIASGLQWPGRGVYLTAVEGAGDTCFGVTNVGGSPTFRREEMLVETHILNFQGDLYRKRIKVLFLEKLRETIPFSAPEELRNQMSRDIMRASRMAAAGYRPLQRGFLEAGDRAKQKGKFIYN